MAEADKGAALARANAALRREQAARQRELAARERALANRQRGDEYLARFHDEMADRQAQFAQAAHEAAVRYRRDSGEAPSA